jgi:hypothetical protein
MMQQSYKLLPSCDTSGSHGGEYKMTDFWDIARVVWQKQTNVSDALTDSIIRVITDDAVSISETSTRLRGTLCQNACIYFSLNPYMNMNTFLGYSAV